MKNANEMLVIWGRTAWMEVWHIFTRDSDFYEWMHKATAIFPCTFFPPWFNCSNSPRPRHCWSLRNNTQTHHTLYDSSVRVIGLSQKTLPENTQHSQGTDIYETDGIWTRNPSKRAAVDPHPRRRGVHDRRHKPQALQIHTKTSVTNSRKYIPDHPVAEAHTHSV